MVSDALRVPRAVAIKHVLADIDVERRLVGVHERVSSQSRACIELYVGGARRIGSATGGINHRAPYLGARDIAHREMRGEQHPAQRVALCGRLDRGLNFRACAGRRRNQAHTHSARCNPTARLLRPCRCRAASTSAATSSTHVVRSTRRARARAPTALSNGTGTSRCWSAFEIHHDVVAPVLPAGPRA